MFRFSLFGGAACGFATRAFLFRAAIGTAFLALDALLTLERAALALAQAIGTGHDSAIGTGHDRAIGVRFGGDDGLGPFDSTSGACGSGHLLRAGFDRAGDDRSDGAGRDWSRGTFGDRSDGGSVVPTRIDVVETCWGRR